MSSKPHAWQRLSRAYRRLVPEEESRFPASFAAQVDENATISNVAFFKSYPAGDCPSSQCPLAFVVDPYLCFSIQGLLIGETLTPFSAVADVLPDPCVAPDDPFRLPAMSVLPSLGDRVVLDDGSVVVIPIPSETDESSASTFNRLQSSTLLGSPQHSWDPYAPLLPGAYELIYYLSQWGTWYMVPWSDESAALLPGWVKHHGLEALFQPWTAWNSRVSRSTDPLPGIAFICPDAIPFPLAPPHPLYTLDTSLLLPWTAHADGLLWAWKFLFESQHAKDSSASVSLNPWWAEWCAKMTYNYAHTSTHPHDMNRWTSHHRRAVRHHLEDRTQYWKKQLDRRLGFLSPHPVSSGLGAGVSTHTRLSTVMSTYELGFFNAPSQVYTSPTFS